ncbi:MAG: hypothetical protein J7497_12820 [Chitinophagaceae bacterium]|nr:hypothetical protein [Chitinophagaceae bacterium]
MKALLIAITALGIFQTASAQTPVGKIDSSKKLDTLEVSCGMCQFEMSGNDCALAAKVNTRTYYVEGTHIDKHGDAHAKDGFCNMIRKAEVQGSLEGDKYKVTYFKLLPLSNPSDKKQ